ncbi:CinA family protein [Komagataeibacter sp. FNDCF1]|uniref:CinA family protein n=1 Tax=Komagataeibacter sp. FNDCF1 TaxID=2878681 RepID=UPI001E399F4F|nr:CinA family protein [Komagataeibacter sp. FNDCF1]MCE2564034.1 CinA family protein [Komagataeibacter sp. FNDCF1]
MLPDTLLARIPDALARFRAAGCRIVTAESCTGGLLVAALTEAAGSSDVVAGGFVTYSNAMKSRALGVPPMLLERYGAVSREVAATMAQGALAHAADANLAIAITGIAGPGGAVEGKPVGLVWFGVAGGGSVDTVSHIFAGERWDVRAQAVRMALTLLLDHAGRLMAE